MTGLAAQLRAMPPKRQEYPLHPYEDDPLWQPLCDLVEAAEIPARCLFCGEFRPEHSDVCRFAAFARAVRAVQEQT